MSARQFWFVLGVILLVLMLVVFAHAARAGMLGGVGTLMGPTAGNGSSAPSNAIVTEAGSPITTEAGSILVTE